MAKIEITVETLSRADPASVFRLLRDGATWPRWSLFDGFELEREGTGDDRLGVGSVRVFTTPVSRAREEVVEIIPDRRLSYVLLSGLPFDDYRAEVDLAPRADGGTLIRWRSRFLPRQRMLGWFWRGFMTRTLGQIGEQMARAAEDPAIVAAAAP